MRQMILLVWLMAALTPVAQAGPCRHLCETGFWKSATPADIQTLIDAGTDLNTTDWFRRTAPSRRVPSARAGKHEQSARDARCDISYFLQILRVSAHLWFFRIAALISVMNEGDWGVPGGEEER